MILNTLSRHYIKYDQQHMPEPLVETFQSMVDIALKSEDCQLEDTLQKQNDLMEKVRLLNEEDPSIPDV